MAPRSISYQVPRGIARKKRVLDHYSSNSSSSSVCPDGKDDAIGHLPDKTHFMSHHEHRSAFNRQRTHNLQHLSKQLRVRFIGKQSFGFHCQSARDSDPLLLAAKKMRGIGYAAKPMTAGAFSGNDRQECANTAPPSYLDFGCAVLPALCKPKCCSRLQLVTRTDAAFNWERRRCRNGLSNPCERHAKKRTKAMLSFKNEFGYFANGH